MKDREFEKSIVACNDLFFIYKKKLISLLSEKIKVDEADIFYTWCERKIEQKGFINNYYKYYFHGYECDFRGNNGEHIRVEFGPNGRVDTFTFFGLSSFIKTCLSGIATIYPDLIDEGVYEKNFSDKSIICKINDINSETRNSFFDLRVSHRLIIKPETVI